MRNHESMRELTTAMSCEMFPIDWMNVRMKSGVEVMAITIPAMD